MCRRLELEASTPHLRVNIVTTQWQNKYFSRDSTLIFSPFIDSRNMEKEIGDFMIIRSAVYMNCDQSRDVLSNTKSIF